MMFNRATKNSDTLVTCYFLLIQELFLSSIRCEIVYVKISTENVLFAQEP